MWWCVDRCDDPDTKEMHCKHKQLIQIQEINVLRTNSDNNANDNNKNIDNKLRYPCKRLFALRRTIRHRCNGNRVCSNEHKYRDWNDCPGMGNLSSRPVVLEIAFECASRKYRISSGIKIFRTNINKIYREI